MQPDSTTGRKPNTGHFRKGDPRRHQCTRACTHPRYQFTPQNCSDGFFAALAAIATRNPRATPYGALDYFKAQRAARKGAAR